jgi:hypothetical protein
MALELTLRLDLRQGEGAINARLPVTQQIKVWAIK